MVPAPTPPPIRPIIKEICTNSGGAFSGFGRHLANDFLFNAAIHPATPAIYICEDDESFTELLEGIPAYLKRFTRREYYNPMLAGRSLDRKNPFEFHENSNRHYMQSYIDVFRRCSVQVPKELYVKYLKKGLLDHRHTIGEAFSIFDSHPSLKVFCLLSTQANLTTATLWSISSKEMLQMALRIL